MARDFQETTVATIPETTDAKEIGRPVKVGKRFTKVKAVEFSDGGQHQEIDTDMHATRAQMRARSIRILEAAGIPVSELLEAAPGGSMLQDRVLNYLDHPADSELGLAARIVELCNRLDVYEAEGAPMREVIRAALLLGRLDALARVYRVDDAMRASGLAAAQKSNEKGRTKRAKTPPATPEERAEWVRLWDEEFKGMSANKAAPLIAEREGYDGPKRSAQTIRKHLKQIETDRATW
jgi:hypothetical protein